MRNLAVVGELGSRFQTSGTNAKLIHPMKRKIPWYWWRTWDEPVALPIPYARKGPMMAAQELAICTKNVSDGTG